jgi:hypothetical protein
MTARAVAAGSPGLRYSAGSAAAGIAEFLLGRAFFPVADARLMLVRLAARTGVFGCVCRLFNGNFLTVVGCAGWFWHSGTFGFFESIITHMRINHLKDRILHFVDDGIG